MPRLCLYTLSCLLLSCGSLLAQRPGLQKVIGFPYGARYVAVLDSASDSEGGKYFLAEFRKNSLEESLGIPRREGEVNKYIVKYDSGDSLLFAKTVGGSHFELFDKIGVGPDGHIYVTGFISSDQVNLPLGYVNNTTRNFFVSAYDTAGVAQWAVFVPGRWMRIPYTFEFSEGWVYLNSVYTGRIAVLQNKYPYLRRPQ